MPKIELYPHNQAALNHLEEALKYTRRAAVIQPTGTGKSFVALAFIERRPNNSFLYLAPSTHIFNQLKHHAGHTDVLLHTTMMTYQNLGNWSRTTLSLMNFTAVGRMTGEVRLTIFSLCMLNAS